MSDPVNQEIYNMNVSADEKFYLFAYNTFPEIPLLSNIRNYNLLLSFSCPPNGTQVMEGRYIHNIWVRAITVMPSVMDEEGNYWALPRGELLVAHNYSIRLPRSATNLYPDCGITYTLLNSSAQLSVYADGSYTGDSDLTSYMVNSTNLEVSAKLSVSASVRRDYYEPYCYCCKSGKEGCEETCCYCKFSHSDVDGEKANPSSSLERRVYHLEVLPNLTMLQCPAGGFGAAEGNFSLNTSVPIQSFLLSFGSSNVSVQMNKLDIMPILKPHNVLEARSAEYGYQFSYGMFVSGFSISKSFVQLNFTGVPQQEARAKSANLVLTDLFGITHNLSNYTPIVCPLNPQMELAMPHWAEKGSDFQVVVKLYESEHGIAGKNVVLHYSGREYAGTTDSEGKALFSLKANESLVIAKSPYDGKYAEVDSMRNLMVYEPSTLSFLISFSALFFILVLSYTALKFIGGWNL